MSDRMKRILVDTLYETMGNALIAVGTVNIAASSGFAVAGVSGIALMLNRLFCMQIGAAIVIMNIPLALLCFKYLGSGFMARTVRCIIIQSILIDYAAPLLPTLEADRIICALSTGLLFGAGYAMIYMRGSSTGGSDFLIMLTKHFRPHLNTGRISFGIDSMTFIAYLLVFRDVEAVMYGILIAFISSTVIDRIVLGMNSAAVALIVSPEGRGKAICDAIDRICSRGATILEGRGGYMEDRKEIVMVTGSSRDIYSIQKYLKTEEPDSFVVILDSREVQGEGFKITRASGDSQS
ncbi:MAG: YitT family protein [Firmicutes bacterium]|nr:YitT family protein [Bacillota bacterium]